MDWKRSQRKGQRRAKGTKLQKDLNTSDHLKAYNAMTPVDKACKAGIEDEELHFSLTSVHYAANANSTSLVNDNCELLH
jgi:hypothetical protein